MIKKFSGYIIAIGLLTWAILPSCRPKPIEIELPEHKEGLVITSQVFPGFIVVGVTKSFSSLRGSADTLQNDSNFISSMLIEHALVTLSYGGRNDTLISAGSGIYIAPFPEIINGEFYKLYVRDSTSGLECYASTQMMPRVEFKHIKSIIEHDTVVSVDFELLDPGVEDNFFMISIYDANQDTAQIRSGGLVIGNRPTITNNLLLISDKSFTDGNYQDRHYVEAKPSDTSLAVTLSHISEDYYKFLVAYKRSGSLINQITGEPITYPSNVVNGYGFFTMHNPSLNVLDITK